MNCQTNPHEITVTPDGAKLNFRWRNVVQNSDGTTSRDVAYLVLSTESDTIVLQRLRDAKTFRLILGPDGGSYRFGEDLTTDTASYELVYHRCATAGS